MTSPARPAPPTRSWVPRLDPIVVRLLAALVAGAILTWAGVRSGRRHAEISAQVNRAERTLADFSTLRERYEPAVAAESILWRRALLELQDLGIMGGEHLAITQRVARAAEAAGLEDVRVLLAPPDTTGSEARLTTEGVQRKAAAFGLEVECRGGLRAVVGFLGELPLAVAPTRVELVRQTDRARHRIRLAVYELTFSNGPPTLWSSMERGDGGRGGTGRPGG